MGVLLRPGPLFAPRRHHSSEHGGGGAAMGLDSDEEADDVVVSAMVESVMTASGHQPGMGGGGGGGGPAPCGPDEFEQSYVRQWGVPPSFIGRPYHELFVWRATRGALPLALVRAPTAGGASHPYVYSTPRPTAVLNRFDMLIGAAPSWFAAMEQVPGGSSS